jgi:hypothetical protein
MKHLGLLGCADGTLSLKSSSSIPLLASRSLSRASAERYYRRQRLLGSSQSFRSPPSQSASADCPSVEHSRARADALDEPVGRPFGTFQDVVPVPAAGEVPDVAKSQRHKRVVLEADQDPGRCCRSVRIA